MHIFTITGMSDFDDPILDDDRPEPTEEDLEAAFRDWERQQAAEAEQDALYQALLDEMEAAAPQGNPLGIFPGV